MDGAWLPLTATPAFVAAASPAWFSGDVALLVGQDGEVYLAR